MRKVHTFKSWSIVILIMLLVFPSAMAQAKYKHLPRVKIEKVKPMENIEIPFTIAEEPVTPASTEVVTADSENLVVATEKKPTPVTSSTKTMKTEKIKKVEKVNKDGFSESVKQKSNIMDVRDVKKTNILGYLLWFLIVLLLGIAIFVLAFIFLGIIVYSAFYVLLVFGIVGLTIALFILIFGLSGIIA